MKVKGFVRSRMRESRTYGSVRGGYRKVPVYSIVFEIKGGEDDEDRCKINGMDQKTEIMSCHKG